jgi:hypothetical protein
MANLTIDLVVPLPVVRRRCDDGVHASFRERLQRYAYVGRNKLISDVVADVPFEGRSDTRLGNIDGRIVISGTADNAAYTMPSEP